MFLGLRPRRPLVGGRGDSWPHWLTAGLFLSCCCWLASCVPCTPAAAPPCPPWTPCNPHCTSPIDPSRRSPRCTYSFPRSVSSGGQLPGCRALLVAGRDRGPGAKSCPGSVPSGIDGGAGAARPACRDCADPGCWWRRTACSPTSWSPARPPRRSPLPSATAHRRPSRPGSTSNRVKVVLRSFEETIYSLQIVEKRERKGFENFFWRSCSRLTCDAREKLGPGDLFLLGAGGALFPGPDVLPFRFLRLLAGLCDSERNKCNDEGMQGRSDLGLR